MKLSRRLRENDRVRLVSDSPDREPVGTVTEVGYTGAVKIVWDDGHRPTIVLGDELSKLERV